MEEQTYREFLDKHEESSCSGEDIARISKELSEQKELLINQYIIDYATLNSLSIEDLLSNGMMGVSNILQIHQFIYEGEVIFKTELLKDGYVIKWDTTVYDEGLNKLYFKSEVVQ